MAVYSESLSNLNTVSLHIDTTDYTNVTLFFFFQSYHFVSHQFSLSPLCIWAPFSFSFTIVCHTFAFLQQCSLPRKWASGWRVCPPVALCRCGKTGEPSTASWTTERYGPLHWTAEPTVKPMSFRFCSAEDRVTRVMNHSWFYFFMFLVFF